MLVYTVVSSDGSRNQLFETPEEASFWAKENEEDLGDWWVDGIYVEGDSITLNKKNQLYQFLLRVGKSG